MTSELKSVKAELAAARQAALDGTGREKELARQHEAKMEEEREKRVAHAQHMAMMRLTKRDLVLGWTCWHDKYQAHARSKRLLTGAGMRLLKPKLVAAVRHWRRDWEAERLASARMSDKERLAKEVSANESLQREVSTLKDELKAARQAMLDGSGREAELSRLSEEQLAKEREKRIEHAQHMAMMRLTKRDWCLVGRLGMTSGHYSRSKRLLQGAGARLCKLKLSAALHHWRRDWEVEMKAKATMSSSGAA